MKIETKTQTPVFRPVVFTIQCDTIAELKAVRALGNYVSGAGGPKNVLDDAAFYRKGLSLSDIGKLKELNKLATAELEARGITSLG